MPPWIGGVNAFRLPAASRRCAPREYLGEAMSDKCVKSGGNAASEVKKSACCQPECSKIINRVGIGCLLIAVLLIYTLIASWPVVQVEKIDGIDVKSYKAWHFFFWTAESWDVDKRMLFTIVLAGAVGSLVHALTSFSDFVGNERFNANWVWWYVLRLPVGSALAIFFYFIIRGGLIVPTLQGGAGIDSTQATLALNAYSMAAFAALAGMFAKNASDKLAEVFDAVMSRKNPVDRKDPLHDGAGGDLKTEPGMLTTWSPIMLAVLGKGFKKDLEVKINGVKRNTNSVADNRIEIAITATDVAKAGPLELSVKNPNE